MDRTRPCNHQQPVIGTMQDTMDRLPRTEGHLGGFRGQRQLAQHVFRFDQLFDF